MKNFIDICKMSQSELKRYLQKYMGSKKYATFNGDGYLLCRPRGNTIPVLLVAHMDTVHKEEIKEVAIIPTYIKDNVETRISSPQGIGGDDRCGVWAIMQLVKQYSCPVLFCEDEETGCVGSRKFTKTELCETMAKEISYMIQIDRKGLNDAVYYSNDNADFKEWIKVNTSFKEAIGSYTDIEELMPAMNIAGVNFSSGYYNQHTTSEYVVQEELDEIIDRIGDLLALEIPKKFEYVEKKRTYYGGYYGYDDYDYDYSGYFNNRKNLLQSSSQKNTTSKSNLYSFNNTKYDDDDELTLTVEIDSYYDDKTETIKATGKTKYECWTHLFKENPDLSYGLITYARWS